MAQPLVARLKRDLLHLHRTPPDHPSSYSPPVLTDEEADIIRRKLAEGWRGPVLVTWLEQLLLAREERRRKEREAEAQER